MKHRYYELLGEADSLPEGRRKAGLLEEAVRLADSYLTVEDAYYARMSYSEAALFAGYPERFLLSFAWCVSAFEREADRFPALRMLWHYKWAISQIWRFPAVPLAKVEAVFADFRRICLSRSYSLRPYHQAQMLFALARRDHEAAAGHLREWREAPRDELSDCRACEVNGMGQLHFKLSRYKRGLQTVKPILEGRLSCAEVPQRTYGRVLLPLLETGGGALAAVLAGKGGRLLELPRFLAEYAYYLEYYAATDLTKAVRFFERSAEAGNACRTPWDRYEYLLSARLFLQQWHKKKRRKRLLAPAELTLDGVVRETDALAEAFDRRNGSDGCRTMIREMTARMERLAEH